MIVCMKVIKFSLDKKVKSKLTVLDKTALRKTLILFFIKSDFFIFNNLG